MTDSRKNSNQITHINSFDELVGTPFFGEMNAICWQRNLTGDFTEIVSKIALKENITIITEQDLIDLSLSEKGQLARETLLNDFALLKANGASPSLNLIKCYERDSSYPFSTDVYSFHVDRSPIPTSTFLCTYYGEPSEIIPNTKAVQKILVPEIRERLIKMYNGAEDAFEEFLAENYYDLHYEPLPNAQPIGLGIGNLWRLAVDHPQSNCLPCIHRAPFEKNAQNRLLMIC